MRFAGLHVLARPRVYAAFARLLGDRLDATLNGAVRGFAADELLARIRRRPSAPLLALLERRLRRFDGRRLARRTELGERAAASLACASAGARSTTRTGCSPSSRTIPARSSPGSDARGSTRRRRRAPSAPFPPPPDRPDLDPVHARELMERVVFLPVYPELAPELDRLLAVVAS